MTKKVVDNTNGKTALVVIALAHAEGEPWKVLGRVSPGSLKEFEVDGPVEVAREALVFEEVAREALVFEEVDDPLPVCDLQWQREVLKQAAAAAGHDPEELRRLMSAGVTGTMVGSSGGELTRGDAAQGAEVGLEVGLEVLAAAASDEALLGSNLQPAEFEDLLVALQPPEGLPEGTIAVAAAIVVPTDADGLPAGHRRMTLGDLVASAHAASNLDVDQWNRLPDAEREELIAVRLAEIRTGVGLE